jgi:hypothetical protein
MIDFSEAAGVSRRPDRIAALAAWLQGLCGEDPPILVGGGAVELYTAGAYVTGDLDFVGTMDERTKHGLEEVGFRKAGRHWVHQEERVFLEFPGSELAPGQRAVELQLRDWIVRLVSPEDALVDRLAAWKHWRSSVDGASAFLIWTQQSPALDLGRLAERARKEHVADALEELRAFSRRLEGRIPTEEEVRRWAERTK